MFLEKAFLLIEFLISFFIFISCITVISSFLYLNFKTQNMVKKRIKDLNCVINYLENYNKSDSMSEIFFNKKEDLKINISSIKVPEIFVRENSFAVKDFIVNKIEINGTFYEFS